MITRSTRDSIARLIRTAGYVICSILLYQLTASYQYSIGFRKELIKAIPSHGLLPYAIRLFTHVDLHTVATSYLTQRTDVEIL